MMKTARIPLVLCVLLASGSLAAEDKPNASKQDDPNALIATVNGAPYSLNVFRMFYQEQLQQSRNGNSPEFQQQVLDEFMTLVVASQEGDRRKLADDPDVATALLAAQQLERMKLISQAAGAAMANEINPSEDELKTAYDKIKSDFEARVKEQGERIEYKARHILVKDEDEAKKIIKQLNKGEDFAELAKKSSTGPTGKDGGELDWFDASQMVAPFAEAVAAMKPGTYSKTPVQTQFGWHVIELQETRKAEAPKPPTFEDAKPQLEALLKRQKISETLAKMRNEAKVEFNEEIVKITQDDATPEAAPKDQ